MIDFLDIDTAGLICISSNSKLFPELPVLARKSGTYFLSWTAQCCADVLGISATVQAAAASARRTGPWSHPSIRDLRTGSLTIPKRNGPGRREPPVVARSAADGARAGAAITGSRRPGQVNRDNPGWRLSHRTRRHLIKVTGTSARCTVRVVTDPISRPLSEFRPRVPITI